MKNLWLAIPFLILSACGGSGKSDIPNSDEINTLSESKQFYYKAVDGQDADVLPVVGIRLYDNVVHGYSFYKSCSSSSEISLHTGMNDLPLTQDELFGPRVFGADCDMTVKYTFKDDKLIVRGIIGQIGVSDDIQITLTKISQDEFIQELDSSNVNFKGYFNKQSAFDKDNRLSQLCEDLFNNSNCSEVFSL